MTTRVFSTVDVGECNSKLKTWHRQHYVFHQTHSYPRPHEACATVQTGGNFIVITTFCDFDPERPKHVEYAPA